MCHVMMHKASDNVMEAGIVLKAGTSANKENSSGGGTNYFVSAKPVIVLNSQSLFHFNKQYFCYKNPFLATLEHVPKI